jgi:NtrC-family two-component system sensor histidine kinase KinB
MMIQTILNQITDAVLLLDLEACVRLSNDRFETLFGLQLQEGESLDDHAEALGLDKETVASWLNTLHPEEGAFQLLLGVPMPGEGLLLVFTDETETVTLRQTQDEITSMIVHDLRSPLTAVTASIRLLRDLAEPDDSLGNLVLQTTEISGRAVRKLLNLVNSLLDVFKMESGVVSLEREPVNLYTLIATIFNEMTPLAREMEVNLRQIETSPLPTLTIDADKIERVLYNLLDNAIKFTPGGGAVTVRTAEQDKYVRVEVIDTGSGIPDAYKTRLFDRYQQVQGNMARRRGTGLGLTYCKLAVEAHGGHIWIEDYPGGGAVFVFTLPLPAR